MRTSGPATLFLILIAAVVTAQIPGGTLETGIFDQSGTLVQVPDSDNDGVLNAADDCAGTTQSSTTDRNGCSPEQRTRTFTVLVTGNQHTITGDESPQFQAVFIAEGNQHFLYTPDLDGTATPLSEGTDVTVGSTDLTIDRIRSIDGGFEYRLEWQQPFGGKTDCATLRVFRYYNLDAQTVLGEPLCFQDTDGPVLLYQERITCARGHTADYDSPGNICIQTQLGEPCTSNTECASGTCNQRCVEPQQQIGGACDDNHPCANGQCWQGQCYTIANIGDTCDAQTLCQNSGCDVTTRTCVTFLPSTNYASAQNLYELSAPGNVFLPIGDHYAWINIYQDGSFSFSVIVYNGRISTRDEQPLPYPTHVLYVQGNSMEHVNAVSLRALLAGYSLLTAPVQPVLNSIIASADALGIALPSAFNALTQFRDARLYLQQLINARDVSVIITLESEPADTGYRIHGSVIVDGAVRVTSATVNIQQDDFVRQFTVPFETDQINQGRFTIDVPHTGVYTVTLLDVTTPLGTLSSDAHATLTIRETDIALERE